MDLTTDFLEFLELFNSDGVEYVIVGGFALAHHGAPRYTGDLDIYIRPTRANAARVIKSLHAFGFESLGLTEADFSRTGNVIQLGHAPWRIDRLTSIDGPMWEEVDAGADRAHWGVPTRVIGRTELLRNKAASGRPVDLADLDRLAADE